MLSSVKINTHGHWVSVFEPLPRERQEAEKHAELEDAPAPASDVTAGKPDIFGEAAEDDAE